MDNLLELGDDSGGRARMLIRALDKVLRTVPADTVELSERADQAELVLAELGSVGIDGENLLRYGMAPRAALPLLVGLVGSADNDPIDLDRWRELLHISPTTLDLSPEAAAAALTASIHAIDSWVLFAPLREVLLFRPPSDAILSEFAIENRERSELSLPYFWLYMRSTQEDLERWPTEALLFEYRWRADMQRSPFPPTALDYEGPDSAVLNDQIAYRAALGSTATSDHDETLFWQLQDTAVSFLKRARYKEASALFEFHNRLHPDDPRGLNNLGFCKLPSDAEASLDLLKRAESAGYAPLLINVYNQCCCLVRLNRLAEALDRAEFLWQRELDPEDINSGYIWVEDSGTWSLMSHAAVDRALAELMANVAAALGRSDREARWSERVAEIETARAESDFAGASNQETDE